VDILEVDTSSEVVFRYVKSVANALTVTPVRVEKKPLLIFRVDAVSVEVN
jgi:hypothetical protein